MFSNANMSIIAQTGAVPFIKNNDGTEPTEDISFFYDIAFVNNNTGTPSTTEEQVLLATSRGLYISTAENGIQNISNASDANWQNIPNAGQGPFFNLKSLFNNSYTDNSSTPICESSIAPTIWPIGLSDPTQRKIFGNGNLLQITSGPLNNTFSYAVNPLNFINKERNLTFNDLAPIRSLATDGARRFIVSRSQATGNDQLSLLPFDTQSLNISQLSQLIIPNASLANIASVYWIKNIGNTGKIYMATNLGIFTLE